MRTLHLGDPYQAALTRMTRLCLWVGAAGILAIVILQGPRTGLGFAVGAAISYVNFLLIQRMVNSIGSGGTASNFKAVLAGLRYLLLAGVVYVIVKILDITHAAVIEGLFVSVAAVLLELLYKLVNPNRL
jgi:hypothetical protein